MKALILGAGGHAQVVADVLLCAYRGGGTIVPIGYLDNALHLQGQTRLGLQVLGSLEQTDKVPHDAVILAIGDNRARWELYEWLRQRGESFATAIHPRSVIASDVRIGPGSVVCAGTIINPGSVIGVDVILNTGCTVDHHNSIGDHVHIAPGARLGGDVAIGTGTLVGMGAVVLPQRKVGEWSVIGAGAVVTTDVPPNTVLTGIPARPVDNKEREGNEQ